MNILKLITISLYFAIALPSSGGQAEEIAVQKKWTIELRIQPLNASIIYKPSEIVISGPVADEQTRRYIIKYSNNKFPTESTEDDMFLDPLGVDFRSAQFAVGQLARLTAGEASIDEKRSFSISGQAKTTENINQIIATIWKDIPVGLTLGEIQILPPFAQNFVWSVSRTPHVIFIDGFVPSDDAKQRIFADTKAQFPREEIKDTSVVAMGAPANFTAAAQVGLSQLRYGDFLSTHLSDDNYSVLLYSNTHQGSDPHHGVFTQAFIDAMKNDATSTLPTEFKVKNVDVAEQKPADDKRSVDILFATDRAREDKLSFVNFGSSRADSLFFGAVRVHIPEDHRIGNIELPGAKYVFLGIRVGTETSDPNKHFIIEETKILDLDTWKKQIRYGGDRRWFSSTAIILRLMTLCIALSR